MRLTDTRAQHRMDTVTLSSKGQLVIPKAVRDHAKVVPGSRFSVHYVDGEIHLRPLARTGAGAATLDEVAGCLSGVARAQASTGRLLMTNHDQPEAVILSLQEYRPLTEQAARAQRDSQDKLDSLSRAFDAELAVLQKPDAGDRLRSVFDAPLGLNGEVVAGRSD
jgi:AbrB family looped-hinge helix DNA binding protein